MWHFRFISVWLSIAIGLVLASRAAAIGWDAFTLLSVPAVLIIGGGLRTLLNPDLRGPQNTVLGAFLCFVLALPAAFLFDLDLAATLLTSAVCAWLAAGWAQIRFQPEVAGVPHPAPTPAYAAKVGLDDGFLGMMSWLAPLPGPAELREVVQDTDAAHALFSEHNWIANPGAFHHTPPDLISPQIQSHSVAGLPSEWLQFDSVFEPHPDSPGRKRWLSYRENRKAHALILRHSDSQPWLICVHGFGMGSNWRQDAGMFRVASLYREYGLNIAMVTLPVHGARCPGGFNGAKFLPLSPIDFVHAEAQAVWDIRRLLTWIRHHSDAKIGVHGISLGGYTSALLAGLDGGLDCVIAGIPPSDVLQTREHAMGSIERRILRAGGLDFSRYRDVLSVVSPLGITPRVDIDGRFMYAGCGDQFVPLEQTAALWEHWQRPRIAWCKGGHVSTLIDSQAHALVDEAIAARLSGAVPHSPA